MQNIVKCGALAAIVIAAWPAAVFAQAGGGMATSTTLQAQEAAGKGQRPAGMTRAERLAAKPIDPRVTSGTPVPRKLTPAQEAAERNAAPGSSPGGAPTNPNAEADARRQFRRNGPLIGLFDHPYRSEG